MCVATFALIRQGAYMHASTGVVLASEEKDMVRVTLYSEFRGSRGAWTFYKRLNNFYWVASWTWKTGTFKKRLTKNTDDSRLCVSYHAALVVDSRIVSTIISSNVWRPNMSMGWYRLIDFHSNNIFIPMNFCRAC